jgi:glycosyltransferase involved in cell wall biosynthesis
VLIAMERITGFFADKIICISPSVEKLAHSQFIFSKKKTTVFKKGSSNGIDIKRFSRGKVPQQHIDELKKELGIEDKFVFGFVGRLVDRKGIAEIYQAFSQLYSTNPSIRFLFVGSFENDQVTDKELQGKIINHPGILYVGPQYDVPLYLMLMDVFVLPAWWEGFGNVLVQAAAMGLPVISTKATGCIDAVSDGYNGILVNPKSLEELRDAMLLFYSDSNLRDVMGKNGIEWAKNFESLSIWSEMEKLYFSN